MRSQIESDLVAWRGGWTVEMRGDVGDGVNPLVMEHPLDLRDVVPPDVHETANRECLEISPWQ